MPRQYRLIPVSVEAIQLTPESVQRAAQWCGGVEVEEIHPTDSSKRFVALNIPTLEGVQRASEGDYIVKELSLVAKGRIRVMRAREFESKYEPI